MTLSFATFVPMDNHHPPIMVNYCFKMNCVPVMDQSTPIYNFAKADYVKINEELFSYDWDSLLEKDDLNDAVENFYKIIFESFNRHVPTFFNISSKYPKWFNKDLIKLLKRKKDLSKKLYSTDWNCKNIFKEVS